MLKDKVKTVIDKPLIEAYSFAARPLNWYTLRLKHMEVPEIFFDWYHTTGTMVAMKHNRPYKLGKSRDLEGTLIKATTFIKKSEYAI